MRPALLALFHLLLASFFCIGQTIKPKTDWDAENLKGKVKSYTLYTYNTAKTGELIDSDYAYKSTVCFNDQGHMTLMYAGKDSRLVMNVSYDKEGRKKSTKNRDGKISDSLAYSHDAKGDLITQESFGGHTMLRIIANKAGARDTMYSYDVIGKLTAKVIYHYDAQGNLTEQIRNKADGSPNYKEVYTYDKNHNQLSETRYDAVGKILGSHRKVYDASGLPTALIDSIDFYIGGIPYDKKQGDVYTRTITYPKIDSKGNWLQQDVMRAGAAVQTMKRRIEYY